MDTSQTTVAVSECHLVCDGSIDLMNVFDGCNDGDGDGDGIVIHHWYSPTMVGVVPLCCCCVVAVAIGVLLSRVET